MSAEEWLLIVSTSGSESVRASRLPAQWLGGSPPAPFVPQTPSDLTVSVRPDGRATAVPPRIRAPRTPALYAPPRALNSSVLQQLRVLTGGFVTRRVGFVCEAARRPFRCGDDFP